MATTETLILLMGFVLCLTSWMQRSQSWTEWRDDGQEFFNVFEKIRSCFCVVFLLRHRSQMACCRSTTASYHRPAAPWAIFYKPDFFFLFCWFTATTGSRQLKPLSGDAADGASRQKKKNPEMHQNFLFALMSSLAAVSFHYISWGGYIIELLEGIAAMDGTRGRIKEHSPPLPSTEVQRQRTITLSLPKYL